ncbi:cupin domain-containing protein [Phyllobacterium sp. LjRoot231]|uniref:cupin domain-containing protein n=1 Tax=Phyllobacterium sp. LjRoot231 TaxID=3342289 RepID=UPI003F4FB974
MRILSSDVNERYTSVEIVAQGSGPPLHIHHNEDEHFIVLEGTVRFARGAELFDASAGETVTIPRGVKHARAVRSGMPAACCLRFAPGGFKEAFRALAVASLSEAESILARYGCTIEGGVALGKLYQHDNPAILSSLCSHWSVGFWPKTDLLLCYDNEAITYRHWVQHQSLSARAIDIEFHHST